MKTITIHKTDFHVNDPKSIEKFYYKLQNINEPFEVIFDYPIAEIPSWLFPYKKLAKIDIPASVTEISSHAFEYCKSLTEITIPDSVTKIGVRVFCNCESLIKITLPNTIAEIDEWTFKNCKSLEKITIPVLVTKIGDFAFYGCKSLKEINLPDSVTEIGEYAFVDCTSLKEITLPLLIKSLDSSIFHNCPNLSQITIQQSREDFLKTVMGAENFYDEYSDLISFEDKSLDTLLLKNDSIEQIITNLEPEH